jgi:hypothetical protein
VIAEDEATAWVKDAEAARRAGHPEEARRLAEAGLVDEPYRTAGRVVLALACLELGDAEAARRALEAATAAWRPDAPAALDLDEVEEAGPFEVQSDPLADLAENELDRAFDHAESETVDAWTTNRVAEAALHAVEDGAPEGVPSESLDPPFATETVASLYERQGDPERAQAIRRSLREDLGAAPWPGEERKRWVSTLERWLDNLRRASR